MLTKDNLDARRRFEGIVFLILFALTIPAANWLIGNVGTKCLPGGPCLIPVAPGLMAPSGVTLIGIALVLRDLVQRRLGVGVAVGAILAGAALSALVAPPALVVASAAAFLTPVATPVNLMVMGPGGYRFGDYWKLGLPLLLLFFVVAEFWVPVFWKF